MVCLFGYGLLAGVLLLTPAFPAASLVREKIKGTLALLLNSPMRPASIYLGKLGGVLGFTAVLLAMTLPAAAACYALGGTNTRGGVPLLYVVLAVAAVQTSTLGLLVSSRAHSTDGALRVTYALVLGVVVVPLIPYALLRGGSDPLTQLASLVRCLSPIPAVMEVLGQGDVGSFGISAGGGAVVRYVVLALAGSAACAWATVARLNHKLLDRARPAGVMTEDRSLWQRVTRRFIYLVDPQRRSGAMSLWVNPVMVKEFRSRRFGRSHWTLRLIAFSAILSLAVSVAATTGALGWGVEVIGGGLVLLQIALLILFAPSLAAGLVSSERENGTWRLLRMTPLSPGAVLRGKLMSVAWPLLLLLVRHATGLRRDDDDQAGPGRPGRARGGLPGADGRVPGAAQRRGQHPLPLDGRRHDRFLRGDPGDLRGAAAGLAGARRPFGRETVTAALIADPAAAALQASETPGFLEYDLLPTTWWIVGVACVALLVFLWFRTWRLFRTDEG